MCDFTMYIPTLFSLLFCFTPVFCSLMLNKELDDIFSEPLDLDKYTNNQKRIIKRQLKNQESFLDRWCRPQEKNTNSTLKFIICEGFQVEQEFILSTLRHLEQLEDDIAYTLNLLPNKIYLSSNNYILARTSNVEENTFHVAIFKEVYKNENEEDYERVQKLF